MVAVEKKFQGRWKFILRKSNVVFVLLGVTDYSYKCHLVKRYFIGDFSLRQAIEF